MKKHLSVFGLFCRSTLFRLLVVSAAAVAAEICLFVKSVRQHPSFGLEMALDDSGVMWVLCLWYVLFVAILCIPGSDFKSRSGYTFRRLRISEKWVFVWQSVYNTLGFVMLWAIQIIAAYAICMIYMNIAPAEFLSEQTVFIAFYRSNLLHSILPLEETTKWAVNIIIIVSSGVSTAYFPFANRRGNFAIVTALEAIVAILSFVRELGYFGILPITLVFTTGVSLFNVFAWEEEEAYEQTDGQNDGSEQNDADKEQNT